MSSQKEFAMSSLQFKIFTTVARLPRRFAPVGGPYDLAKDRASNEATLGRFKARVPAGRQSVSVAGLKAEWLLPEGVVAGRTLLYLHGAGFVACSINTHRGLATNIAHTAHARALILEYRLAPEHPYPAAGQDCLSAYRWLLDQGVAPGELIVAGDSSGGCLALSLLVCLRDLGLPQPALGICLSPVTDLSQGGESYARNARSDLMLERGHVAWWFGLYLDGHDPCDPQVSPLYADLHGLPPLLIQVGSAEILLSDSLRLAEQARLSGVQVTLEIQEGGQHVQQLLAGFLPEARQSIAHIGRFVEERMG
jgi:monoterpene epsilon-lactone hydrolase